MPLSPAQLAALARLLTYYDGDAPYDPVNNPGGFRRGGNVPNFEPALKDAATVVQGAGALVQDGQAALASTETARNQAQAAVATGRVAYDTLAQLNANLAPAAGAQGEVRADPTVANNGTYDKVGAAGSGSWVKKSSATVPALDAGLSNLTETLQDPAADRVQIRNAEGFVYFILDALRGLGLADGTFLNGVDERAFRVRSREGHVPLEVDFLKGLGLPSAWLRSSASSQLRLRNEEGFVQFILDAVLGLGLPGGTFVRESDDRAFRVKTRDGHVPFELDVSKGLGLSTVWLRPTSAARLRVLDQEGFITLKVDDRGPVWRGKPVKDNSVAVQAWAGAVTHDGFTVCADVQGSGPGFGRLVVYGDAARRRIVAKSSIDFPLTTERDPFTVWRSHKISVAGLQPSTVYYYDIEVDGRLPAGPPNRVKTFPPANTAAGFSFVFGSCSNVAASTVNSPALDAIAKFETDCLFLLHLGDLTYSDVKTKDIRFPRAENTRRYRSCAPVDRLNRVLPIAYIVSDHDMAGNDPHVDIVYPDGSTAIEVMRNTRQVFSETVPHYPFAQTLLNEPDPDKVLLTQVFSVGKSRFIVLDAYSQNRFEVGDPTKLGNGVNPPGSWDQVSWLKAQLVQAGADGMTRVFLVSAPDWVAPINDGWREHYTAEQTAICDFIRDTPGLPATAILAGDAHFSGADDGTNSDFATGGGLTVPLAMSSPLDMSLTGNQGNYVWNGTARKYTGQPRQYCRVNVDAAGEVTFVFKGAPYNATTGAPTVLGTVSTRDVVPSIAFAAANQSGAAGQIVAVPVRRSWFGAAQANWSSGDGQSGTVSFAPNAGRTTIPVRVPASGSITLTLSNPTGGPLGAQLGAQSTLTLSAA